MPAGGIDADQPEARADHDATPAAGDGAAPDETAYLVFSVGSGRYAVLLDAVVEIRRPARVTPLPLAPDFVRGITNLRGSILAVVDVGAGLSLGDEPVDSSDRSARMIVLRHADLDAAFCVAAVAGVRRTAELLPTVDGMPAALRRYCAGTIRVDAGLAAVIDPEFLVGLRSQIEPVA